MVVEFDPRSNLRLASNLETITEDTVCAEIEGLSISAAPEITGATSFADEAGICSKIPIAPTVAFASGDPVYQDLKEYFRRPRLVYTGSCANSVTPLVNVNVTTPLLTGTWFPTMTSRLAGVQGIRFDLVVRVTVAANPFHGGVLVTAFQYDGSNTDNFQYCRTNLAQLSTNLPHVRLDIAEQTMTEFTIPWLYPVDYMALDSSDLSRIYGALTLAQIVPTPTLTSSPAPTYRVFVHLENLELIGSRPLVDNFVVAQSGGRTEKPMASKTTVREQEHTGVVSGLLSRLSTSASMLSEVPLLSTVTGPAAWATGLAANVASVFGFSKPRDRSMPTRHYRSDYVGETNVDMPSQAFSLAVTADNQLTIDSTMGGMDIDEMSLKYVLSKWSQINLFTIATTDAMGTVLYSSNTCLMHYWYRTGTTRPFSNIAPPFSSATTNSIIPSTLMYWANFFRQWRGSLKFRFTFGKSKFHAGRVIAGFVPNARQVGRTTRNLDNVAAIEIGAGGIPQPFSYTKVFDLRDSSSFEFEVPYLSPYLWTGINAYTGGITLTVLDPLIANGECATTIPILLEVCAGDDFEFAVPCAPTQVPCTGNTGLTVLTQSGGTLGVANSDVKQYTVGESVQSVKQIIMCPTAITVDIAAGGLFETAHPPFPYIPTFPNAVPMALNIARWATASRPGLASACFAYYHGSTAYHLYTDTMDRVGMSMYWSNNDSQSTFSPVNTLYNANNSTLTNHRIKTNYDSLHCEAPPYSFYPRLSIRRMYDPSIANYSPNNSVNGYGQRDNGFPTPVSIVRNLDASRACRVTYALQAADDGRLSTYIGPPPIYLFNPLSTARIEAGPILS